MLLIIGFSLTVFFGLLLTLFFIPKMYPLERLGVSYLLGLGLLTLFMFFYSLLGFKFNLLNTLSVLLIPILVLLFLTKRKIKPFVSELKSILAFSQLSLVERLIVLAIGLFVLYSLLCTLYWPVHQWDALVLYDWRAKLFAETGMMDEAIRRGYFFGVPLLTSLAHTWIYLLGYNNPLFIYTLFLASFVAMFYGALREFTSRIISLVAGLLLVTTPAILGHSAFAYTNFPYTLYFVMGTIYLYIWMVKEKKGYLLLAALMTGLSVFVRAQPFWLVNLGVLIVYSLYKKKLWAPFLFGLLCFSIYYPWTMFEESRLERKRSIATTISKGTTVLLNQFNLSHALEILNFLWRNVFSPMSLFLVSFLIFLFWTINSSWRRRDFWLSGMIIGDILLVVFGTYIFSLTFPSWKVGGSAFRMVMFLPPLVLFYISISKKIREIFDLPRRNSSKKGR